ncbi:MAG: hypothetical protein KatS3mg057_0827 [Herpetosiphonaceae bacterium]|nr:MAG: hypothetical protein KatS3mg057_0827 [Herpetosiphonaceae bacterium]
MTELDERKQQILARLRSIEGHVRGVSRMVEEDAYCMDLLQQTLAIKRALEKINTLILDRHLHTCVTNALQSQDPQARERAISEIIDAFEAAGR